MVFVRSTVVGFVAALTLLSGRAFASSDSSSSVCIDTFISDGDCDLVNDIAECGFDGGDCCECTCVSTEQYTCGENGGFSCLDPSAPCADDDDVTTLPSSEKSCLEGFVGDGDCDPSNNFEECGGFDGGDCCECTCVSTADFTCGDEGNGGFECRDRSAPCFVAIDDDSASDGDPMFDDDMSASYEFEFSQIFSDSFSDSSSCMDPFVGDGECDPENNTEECGYDGGDCCECTCISGLFSICGENAVYKCVDPNAVCVDGYVEVGTKTNVFVSANAYDTRPGQASGSNGCMDDGCAPALSRDGNSDDVESRWSCNPSIVPGGGLCEIEFVFEAPQDVKGVQVVFWKGDERTRTLEAAIDGEVIGNFDSYPGSVFNSFDIKGSDVHTLTLTSSGITQNEWISLIEVRLLVAP